NLADPRPKRARHRHPARLLALAITQEEAVEMLVVAHLVGADRGGDLAQHRLRAHLRQRAVEPRRSGLDHATRGHLQRPGLRELVDRAEAHELGEEVAIGAVPTEIWPSGLDIAPQRAAMLQLLAFPGALQPFDDVGVVAEE